MNPWVPHVPLPVTLRRLFPQASFVGCGDVRVTNATDRSADVTVGGLFAVIRGTRQDGRQFVVEAIDRGAGSLLVDHPMANVAVPQCVVPDVRRAYAELVHALMAQPARHLGLAGVTGTNGKTTTTWLIRAILQAAGHPTGLLGTIEYHDGVECEPSRLTTPDSSELALWMAAMVARRTTHAALELSSHALDQRRTAGIQLDVSVITNITQDHFDYHGDFESYRNSKLRILDCMKPGGLAVINVDNAGSRSCLADAPMRHVTYGIDQPADIRAEIIKTGLRGTRFRLEIPGGATTVDTRLIGLHNVSNCLAAAAAAGHFGATLDEIARGIAAVPSVPGRMEPVDAGQPFEVFVDYAHTEDALRHAIAALKPLTPGRVICIFGAGGDRDRSKRPLLGRAAAQADLPVVTSDNPRSEDPQSIIQEILAGFTGERRQPYVEIDRRQAIRWALQHACPGDVVLIAGKGHETEQIAGNTREHFDDRETARECLATLYPSSIGPHSHFSHRNSLPV
jgi:UDP-N-acetylmuramoyl-L-alanyl-D-glutamate--2,6-diaminopimelate ligase